MVYFSNEIMAKIWSYDPTYKEVFNNCLHEIKDKCKDYKETFLYQIYIFGNKDINKTIRSFHKIRDIESIDSSFYQVIEFTIRYYGSYNILKIIKNYDKNKLFKNINQFPQ
jgi:hypothetical protein